jgi:3-oxoacyl-[acyl-carrier-protein] synthase III
MRSVQTELDGAPAVSETTRPSAIASVSMAVPEGVVPNQEIAERLGVSHDWIVARTGVHERHVAREDERLSELAATAGRGALEAAGVTAEELDLVFVATMAADELTPNAAPLVALELGATDAGAMDVGAACTGFLSGLSLAAAQVESGRAERVLVVGADLLSRLTDRQDRRTAALFGDGAGAAVVTRANGRGWIGPVVLRADGNGAPAIRASHDERLLHMQGHDTFRAAVKRLSEATLQAVERAGIGLEDVDLFVYHQANARILAAVGEQLGLDRDRVIDCIDRYGNTSAATIPIALSEAQAANRLESGATVLLGAFGAGFTWGAGVIEWA